MKKVVALALALMLWIVPLCAAMATGVDLSRMTDEELTELKQQLDAEMRERGLGDTVVLPVGTYTIGKDIPQGDYVLLNENGERVCFYYICATQEDAEYHMSEVETTPLNNLGDSVKITLKTGQILVIYNNSVRMTVFCVPWQ